VKKPNNWQKDCFLVPTAQNGICDSKMKISIKQKSAELCSAAFSMIELLVGMAILGVMFVSLYAGLSAGFAVVQLARENLRATQILQEKMETIRLYTWDQIIKTNFIPLNFVEPFYATGTQNAGGLTFTGLVNITTAPITESYSNELKRVRIRVQWKSAKVLRTREMTTFVTRNGLQNYIY
jgi:prepilin-type N-terminal cleavage/methylation domain-containing protein